MKLVTYRLYSNSELEMLGELHLIEGLSNLRINNLKRAGICFEEAR